MTQIAKRRQSLKTVRCASKPWQRISHSSNIKAAIWLFLAEEWGAAVTESRVPTGSVYPLNANCKIKSPSKLPPKEILSTKFQKQSKQLLPIKANDSKRSKEQIQRTQASTHHKYSIEHSTKCRTVCCTLIIEFWLKRPWQHPTTQLIA